VERKIDQKQWRGRKYQKGTKTAVPESTNRRSGRGNKTPGRISEKRRTNDSEAKDGKKKKKRGGICGKVLVPGRRKIEGRKRR